MHTLDFVLFLAATILFALAALSGRFAAPPNPPYGWGWILGWAGLFCCALDWFIHVAQHQ